MITATTSDNEIYLNNSDRFSLKIYNQGEPATVPSASFRIINSVDKEIFAGTASVEASNKIIVDIPGGTFSIKEENYRIDVTIVVEGKTEVVRKYFNVVDRKILNTVITEDLTDLYPTLCEELPEGRSNFSTQIEEAFQAVKKDIYDKGDRLRLIVDDEQIKPLIVSKSLVIIFDFLSRDTEDVWWLSHEKYSKKYSEDFQKTRFRYDCDRDGNIDGSGSFSVVRCVR